MRDINYPDSSVQNDTLGRVRADTVHNLLARIESLERRSAQLMSALDSVLAWQDERRATIIALEAQVRELRCVCVLDHAGVRLDLVCPVHAPEDNGDNDWATALEEQEHWIEQGRESDA